MIDVTHQINAVTRQVGTRVIQAGEARTTTISQTYKADVEDVWDACTNPERIPRWFLPVTGDLRQGGTYQLEGNAGGTIEYCDRPTSFTATWEYSGAVSWIEVRLTSQADGRTRLELEHIAMEDEHWAQFGPGAVGIGWDMALIGLSEHLTSGQPVDAEAAMAWMASEEGKRFMTMSSQRWAEANIAAGTEEAAARAQADRTTAFYTTQPEDTSAG